MDRLGSGATTGVGLPLGARGQGQPTAPASASVAFLDDAAEAANKQIDGEIKTLIDSFDALIGLCRIQDKDKIRIAQERFEAEARADTMVRSVQSLTLLSHSLKLSLLMSQEPIGQDQATTTLTKDIDGANEQNDVHMTEAKDDADGAATTSSSLNDEALRLIESTLRSRQECARLLQEIMSNSEEATDTVEEDPSAFP